MADDDVVEQVDAMMPNPDEIAPAKVEPEPITGPLPDGEAVIAPPNAEPTTAPTPDSTTEVEEEPEAETLTEAKEQAEANDEPEPEPEDWKVRWNKARQQEDEEDARKGMSKADLRAENERLKNDLAQSRRAAQPITPNAAADASEFEPLPEKDEYGEPMPANIALNAQQMQLRQVIKHNEELLESNKAIDAQLTANANKAAFLEIIDMACEGNEDIRNDLINDVKQLWADRGYDETYYPDPEHTVDAVDSVAQRLINKKLRQAQARAPAKKKTIKSDTGKGGRMPTKPAVHVIEPDFHKAVKRMTAAGRFKA